MSNNIEKNCIDSIENGKYSRKGNLIRRKLMEFIPLMILSNLSLLLINTVDKVVAGNFIGTDAMNSISIFYPVLLVTGSFSTLFGSGIATSLSNAMGNNDAASIAHIKSAGVRIMIVSAIIIGIIQIPIVWAIIISYDVSDELSSMVWQYAIGCMICTPISIISNVGTLQMQITGKMKMILGLTLTEGLCNLAFDLLFIAVLDMGVAGAGYGTACSNLIRCVATVIYLYRCTDFFRGDGVRTTFHDIRSILACGMPDASYGLILAFQNYFTLRIIISSFGEDGGVIYGVCAFCLTLINLLINGIQGGIRPLMGLYAGAEDKIGLVKLMLNGAVLVLLYAGIASIVIMLFPTAFYHLHGVDQIPDGGLLAVKLYAVSFVLLGFNYLQRLYLTNRRDIRFTTALTMLGNATLPLFAFVISALSVPAPFIFLAYTVTELLVFTLSALRYWRLWSADKQDDLEEIVLYMTLRQEDAADAAHEISVFAEEHGIDRKCAYKTSLCIEEMTAYIQQAGAISLFGNSLDTYIDLIQKTDLLADQKHVDELLSLLPGAPINVDIALRFKGSNQAILVTLDDGAFIALDQNEVTQQLITDNYDLIKKIADSVEYQYILNMNYTKIVVSGS